jgi:hypothetical protein
VTVEGTLDARIRFAIEHKRLLRIAYLDKRRVVEPHDYGVQKGQTRLFVYQRYQTAQPKGPRTEGWRMLDVPKCDSFEVLNDTFAGSRGADHQRHNDWDVLFARVSQ